MNRTAVWTATRLLARLQLTAGRIVVSVLVGAAVTLAALAANLGGNSEEISTILIELLLLIVVPVISLIFAAASLGDPQEDGSLVYLWLRPLRRWELALAAVGASAAVALPLNVAVTALTTLVGGRPSLLLPATAAGTVATVAYITLFVGLGLRTTRSLMWGLGFILIIEGFLVRFSEQIAAVSIRRYAVSVLTQLGGGLDNDLHEVELVVAVPLLAALTLVAFGACVRWLRVLDVD